MNVRNQTAPLLIATLIIGLNSYTMADRDPEGNHPNIHRAIRALEDAKDQL